MCAELAASLLAQPLRAGALRKTTEQLSSLLKVLRLNCDVILTTIDVSDRRPHSCLPVAAAPQVPALGPVCVVLA